MAPGHRAERLRKALSCGADTVVFDLEDGVPPAQKAAARQAVAEVLRETAGAASRRGWSAACASTPWPAGWRPMTSRRCRWRHSTPVMVPKVESAAEVRALEALLAHGPGRELPFVLTLETPLGVLRALDRAGQRARRRCSSARATTPRPPARR
jgi:citrate lyase subunit beta/citryl-CoA lyase